MAIFFKSNVMITIVLWKNAYTLSTFCENILEIITLAPPEEEAEEERREI
jgi:hypothetical protein